MDAHIGSLCRQLADVLQVFAQLVTQLSELRLAVVFQAEGESLQHTQQFYGTPAEGNSCHCGTDLFTISHGLPNRILYFFSKFKSCAKKWPQIFVRVLMIKMHIQFMIMQVECKAHEVRQKTCYSPDSPCVQYHDTASPHVHWCAKAPDTGNMTPTGT